jgi:thiol-disulfide isomerase/thioredoxin
MSEQREFATPPARKSGGAWVAIAVVLAAGAGLLLLIAMTGSRGGWQGGDKHPAVGRKIELVELAPLAGNPPAISRADLDGKVTLINFWGPWCGPCAVEFPHLMEIEQHFRERPGFQLISVAYPSGPHDAPTLAQDTAEFLKQRQAKFGAYVDPAGATASHVESVAELAGFVLPTTIVVGRDGAIRGLWAGYRRGDEREVERVIEETLKSERNST